MSSPHAAALTDGSKAVASVAAYARSASGSLADLPLSLVAGRVCRGANEAAFDTLYTDGLLMRPVVFVTGQNSLTHCTEPRAPPNPPPTPPTQTGTGEHGLAMLLGPGTVLERLLRLGYEKRWIAKKLADGERFRLALFPARGYILPATWDGVFTTVRQSFPEVAAKVPSCHSP